VIWSATTLSAGTDKTADPSAHHAKKLEKIFDQLLPLALAGEVQLAAPTRGKGGDLIASRVCGLLLSEPWTKKQAPLHRACRDASALAFSGAWYLA
jgi:hypothetical protein